ncbi:MAG: hypothetical protein K2Q09_06270, partial [Phycisphaerales bacterium]|nr:hypothetical protein [Phycisphaerales bacterium]
VNGSAGGRAVQIGGFVIGLGLLAWCVWLVASDRERVDQARRLAESPAVFGQLVALSVGVQLCTGMLFRSVLVPVARLPVGDVLAVNSIATLLNNLPFKLSLVARAWLHRTRNGVPLPQIVAWMVASACVMAASVLPPVAATLVLKRVDGAWWGLTIGGTAALGLLVLFAGRVFRSDRVWTWVAEAGGRRPRTIGVATRHAAFAQLRDGPRMFASPAAVGLGLFWRSGAMGLGVWRFAVAAAAVGGVMTIGQCVVADSVYYSIQAAAPTGALGAREGGTVAAVAAVAGRQLPVVVLAVSAAETAANLLCAGAALLYLKLVRPAAKAEHRP